VTLSDWLVLRHPVEGPRAWMTLLLFCSTCRDLWLYDIRRGERPLIRVVR